MARKINCESKVPTSVTIFRHQKDWLNSNPAINFSAWLREELENLIIRQKSLVAKEVN